MSAVSHTVGGNQGNNSNESQPIDPMTSMDVAVSVNLESSNQVNLLNPSIQVSLAPDTNNPNVLIPIIQGGLNQVNNDFYQSKFRFLFFVNLNFR